MSVMESASLLDWDDVPLETVNAKMKRRIITGELMTVARIYFTDGFVVPMHSHHNEQITQVLKGTLRFWFGDDGENEVDIPAGGVVVIPAHLPHKAQAIGEVEEMDIWAPRRDDWLDGTDDYLKDGSG